MLDATADVARSSPHQESRPLCHRLNAHHFVYRGSGDRTDLELIDICPIAWLMDYRRH